MTVSYRNECDSLGRIQVPDDKYWGAHTQRYLKNFEIGEKQTEKLPFVLITSFATLKKAISNVNCINKDLSPFLNSAIQQACDEIIKGTISSDNFPLGLYQSGSGTETNMNLNEVISNRSNEILGGFKGNKRPVHPIDHVNLSQSSNDTFSTAMIIATVLELVHSLLPSLQALKESLDEKAQQFDSIVKVGRTHLQDANLMTLGQEFRAFSQQIQFSMDRIRSVFPRLKLLPQGAATVGSGFNTRPNFANQVSSEISRITGIEFKSSPNKFEAIATRDSILELSGALNTIASSLFKIANDIRLLGSGPSCGFNELILPKNESVSSLLPGKFNPTQCEALTMVCSQVFGNQTTITMGCASGQLQLNSYGPIIAKNILNSIKLLSDGCKSFSNFCIKDIQANEESIDKMVNRSLFPLASMLLPKYGIAVANEVATKAYEDGISIKESALQLGVFKKETEFDELVHSQGSVGPLN
ncbi:hypothetical protein CANARDRAFT_8956 [[Candida] arabinofermentans NRRL YB-2248]|uniref:fumarate hydratase n=1 Tax=[Candida] arabinofermentans NRRL YB-2248 TaxID=983967 RepID=A0A1E4SWT0_9ASCO|nr:hypothetical protein CANARDRAFT_8956 [[Candida] arabinofermentans NRRL YB-2248]